MVSSTFWSASRSPATALATTSSRPSPEIVIVGSISSVTDGTQPKWMCQLRLMILLWRPESAIRPHAAAGTHDAGAIGAQGGDPVASVRGAADVGEQTRQSTGQRHQNVSLRGLQRGVGDL